MIITYWKGKRVYLAWIEVYAASYGENVKRALHAHSENIYETKGVEFFMLFLVLFS